MKADFPKPSVFRLVEIASIGPGEVRGVVSYSNHYVTRQQRQDGILYSLRAHSDEGTELRNELLQSGSEEDESRWEAWKARQENRRELFPRVKAYLNQERARIQSEWRAEVNKLLYEEGLGCDPNKLLPKNRDTFRRIINSVDVMSPSKRVSVRQKLGQILQKEARGRQKMERVDAVSELSQSLRFDMDHLVASLPLTTTKEEIDILNTWRLIPSFENICKLPIVDKWLQTHILDRDVQDAFAECRDDVAKAIEDEGTQMKREFVKRLANARAAQGLQKYPPRSRMRNTSPKDDVCAKVDQLTGFLLRADNILRVKKGGSTYVLTYRTLVPAFHGKSESGAKLVSFDEVEFDPETSIAAGQILSSAGYQDASCVELGELWFKCGRCSCPNMDGLLDMALHYVEAAKFNTRVEFRRPVLEEQGVAYEYLHDLTLANATPALLETELEEFEAPDDDTELVKPDDFGL
ncbi:hypothetical protein RhiJN_16044 [Ceratobasidium sp. AG-Ba]|nr:hypothetical protein RhiJN_16044 [Ceratobasidium sp. AG-Ba]